MQAGGGLTLAARGAAQSNGGALYAGFCFKGASADRGTVVSIEGSTLSNSYAVVIRRPPRPHCPLGLACMLRGWRARAGEAGTGGVSRFQQTTRDTRFLPCFVPGGGSVERFKAGLPPLA